MLSTMAGYRLYAQSLPKATARVAAQPQVARDTARYLARIEDVKSVDDFLRDSRVFGYAMTAFGLGDMAYAKGFMRKVLAEGVDNPRSFANSLSDGRYREFAAAFNFARYGETATIFDRTRQGTVDRYVSQALEEQAGAQNEGVRLALYFERRASGITGPYQILADAALTKVAQTLLGLPASTSALPIDRQAQTLAARLKLADFSDPVKVRALTQRFIGQWAAQNDTTGTTSAAALFGGQATIDQSLALSLANLRRGGR